ncbi:MAG: orotate phosphoribosyltransferase [Nanoarchaeota archaeon]|nr:orotate phosphoribosyltransferase [Nanoarchaeota archaeon]
MELIKPCSLCRKNIANNTCRLCGTFVCESCYDKTKGICINCSKGKTYS